MPTILTRVPTYSPWNPGELAGPYEALTLREWELAVCTCALLEPHQKLLREALLEPAPAACERKQRWPLPRRILPFDTLILHQASAEALRKHLRDSLATLWQVLDLAPFVIPGMLRGLLLVGLGARLRQTLAAMERHAETLPAQQELERALSGLGAQIEPANEMPTHLQKQSRRKRWWWRGAA